MTNTTDQAEGPETVRHGSLYLPHVSSPAELQVWKRGIRKGQQPSYNVWPGCYSVAMTITDARDIWYFL